MSVAVVLLVILLVMKMTMCSKEGKYAPGPEGSPIVGQAFNLSFDSAHLKFTEWSKQYGDIFKFYLFGKQVVVLNNPDLIRKVFAGKELSLKVADRPSSFLGYYVGCGYKDILFRRYDDICAKVKSFTMKAMYSVKKENTKYDELQLTEINDYVRKITKITNEDVDIIEPLQDSLCKLIGLLVSYFTQF